MLTPTIDWKPTTQRTMSLRESGQYDWQQKLGAQLTGWGIISRGRRSKDGRLSKTQRRKQKRNTIN